jgi:hypothetical protein
MCVKLHLSFVSMQDLLLLRPRVHGGFLEIQYDDRYTPYLSRAGLDVISFQVRRGLPLFNSAGLTSLVDRYFMNTYVVLIIICSHAYLFDLYFCFAKIIGGGLRLTAFTWLLGR